MKPPLPAIAVELLPHDPCWDELARAEAARFAEAMGDVLLRVAHIGSTAIPGICAKPIIDLMPVVTDLVALDARSPAIEALGYDWRGEYGLPGRRYCIRDDDRSGRRLYQAHCYADGSPEIVRHLAFRDHLRANPATAAEYAAEKERCRALYPDDSHRYGACKSGLIQRIEAEALAGR